MEFIEAPVFTRDIVKMLSENEYYELQKKLVENPYLGVVIPEGRGLRKLRWSAGSKGKSGGIRVIYYYVATDEIIYFFTVYKKSRQEDLPKEHLKRLVNFIREGVL